MLRNTVKDESCYLYLERVEGGPEDRRAEKSEGNERMFSAEETQLMLADGLEKRGVKAG